MSDKEHAYHDRAPRIPRWLVLLVFLFTPVAWAEDLPTFSVTGPDGKLTLTAEPCKAHAWLKGWQEAKWYWRGKDYAACWRMQSDGHQKLVVVLDAAGDVTTFYPAQFVQDHGI